MRPTGRILVVDDDRLFLDTYRHLLASEGYTVETAMSRDQAILRLDENDWDVVLLDQHLLGPNGPEVGIELLREARARAPWAKAIIATAYASRESIERAFDAGAYDFLDKPSKFFEHHLRAMVRNAVEAVREQELGHLDESEAEARIAARWRALQTEHDENRKGLLLEELMALLFRSVDGFQVFPPRRRSEDEEIDLVIQPDPSHSFWVHQSPYILVACNNWSRRVGPGALDRFRNEIERHHATLGLFVAPCGFTEGFHSTQSTERKGKILVICIGPDELAALVTASDRNAELEKLHAQAIIDANGIH